MTAVDRLVAILAEHRLQGGLDCYRCTCGASTAKGPDARGWRERHLAAVIASSDDLAVVELPEPNEREDGDNVVTWGEGYNDLQVGVHDEYADQVQVWVDYVPIEPWSPREAEEFASHLLSAAREAEAVTRDGE